MLRPTSPRPPVRRHAVAFRARIVAAGSPESMTVTNERGWGTVRLSVLATKVRSRMVFILLDVAVILAAYGLAEAASLRDRAPADYMHKLVVFLAVTLTVQLIANWCFGLYGRIWRHAGIEEARNIVLSCLATLVVLTALYPLGFAEQHHTGPVPRPAVGMSPDHAGHRGPALPLSAPRMAEGEQGYGLARRSDRQSRCRRRSRTRNVAQSFCRPVSGRRLRR